MLHLEREIVALQEQLQVRVILEQRVVGDLLDAAVERDAPVLNEGVLEAAEWRLLRHGRYNDAGVVERQCLVEPEEVGVPPEHREFGFAVQAGACLHGVNKAHTGAYGRHGPWCGRCRLCAR